MLGNTNWQKLPILLMLPSDRYPEQSTLMLHIYHESGRLVWNLKKGVEPFLKL